MAGKDDLIMRNIFLTLLLMISLISLAQTDDVDYNENVDKICNYVKLLHDSPERYEEVAEMTIVQTKKISALFLTMWRSLVSTIELTKWK